MNDIMENKNTERTGNAMSEKKAVVLGGGGSRGAYEIGVWKLLDEIGYDYRIVTGSSVGALNGAVMAMGDVELGESMWLKISTEMILDYTPQGDITDPENQRQAALELMEKAIRSKSIDQSPLRALLEEVIDTRKVCSSDIALGIVTTKYPSLRGKEVFADEIGPEKLIDYLMASSACFPAMRAYEINGEQYIDGGFYDVLPINLAISRGADEIIAVDLKSPGLHLRPSSDDVKITFIEPRTDLGFLLLFEPNIARTNIARGYFDAKKALGLADGFNYTFEKEAFGDGEDRFRTLLMRILGSRGNASERIIAETQYKLLSLKLIQNTSAEFLKKGTALPAAETTGKLFEINPLTEYTKEEFDRAVLCALDAVKDLELLKNPDLSTAFKTVTDEKYIAKYLVREIRRCIEDNQDMSPAIAAAVGLYPSALIGAVYCIYAVMKKQ